jgi:hypothetical protein
VTAHVPAVVGEPELLARGRVGVPDHNADILTCLPARSSASWSTTVKTAPTVKRDP